jgi:hypothetical protein
VKPWINREVGVGSSRGVWEEHSAPHLTLGDYIPFKAWPNMALC